MGVGRISNQQLVQREHVVSATMPRGTNSLQLREHQLCLAQPDKPARSDASSEMRGRGDGIRDISDYYRGAISPTKILDSRDLVRGDGVGWFRLCFPTISASDLDCMEVRKPRVLRIPAWSRNGVEIDLDFKSSLMSVRLMGMEVPSRLKEGGGSVSSRD